MIDAPASNGFTISPHNTDNLPFNTRAIFVGGAGTVTVVTTKGDTVQFTIAAVPFVIPVQATKVTITGTTATLMVGLY